MNILKLIETGIEKLSTESEESELKSIGTLRGGSVGCLVSDSGNFTPGKFEVIGKCAREAHARFLGLDNSDVKLSSQLMFAAGHGNEAIWAKWLTAAGAHFNLEDPIEWYVDGVKGTGRRDVIIYEDAEKTKPIMGLELKNASALRTATMAALKGEPKIEWLIQAGNYSMRSNDLPYKICCTSYANFTGKEFMFGTGIPKRGAPGSEHCTYSLGYMKNDIKDRRTGKLKKGFRAKDVYSIDQDKSNDYLEKQYGITEHQFNYVNPFIACFDIRWSHDTLEWKRSETMDKWTTTPITKQGIDAYYSLVATAGVKKQLPPRMINVDAFGKVLDWSMEKYSKLLHISDMVEDLPADKQYDAFIELLRKECK